MTPEGKIVKECLEWLNASGYYCWRNNSGAVRSDGRMVRYGKVGSSDILGIMPDGRFMAIECKVDGGLVTKAQASFLCAIARPGGFARIIHSLEELIQEVKG
jgi:hypothetical protein